jgi:hypothetical protein
MYKYIIIITVLIARPAFSLNNNYLYILTPTIRQNQKVKILINIPDKSIYNKWILYAGGQIQEGFISTSMIKTFEFTINKTGTYNAIYILENRDITDNDPKFFSATFEVKNYFIEDLLLQWGGPLSGAFLAIFVFMMQKYIEQRKKKKTFKNMLLTLYYDNYSRIAIDKNYNMVIPDFIQNPSNTIWAEISNQEPFVTIIPNLRKCFEEYNKHGSLNKDMTIDQIKKILVNKGIIKNS